MKLFSSDYAEQVYPSRDLRRAVFATGDAAHSAAVQWMTTTNPDALSYRSHQLVAAMLGRHGSALSDAPNHDCYKVVERQFRMRRQINLRAAATAFEALNALDLPWLSTGHAARQALGGKGAEGLDLLHLFVPSGGWEQQVSALKSAGWILHDPTSGLPWQHGSILFLSQGPSAKMWIYNESQIRGLAQADPFEGREYGTLAGEPVPVAGRMIGMVIAGGQTTDQSVLADQWLFDLATWLKDPRAADQMMKALEISRGLLAAALDWVDCEGY